jgi:NADPH:quinone reductase-like Zn-dependent oxidoreductase
MNRPLRGLAWSPFLRQRLTNFVARQRAADLERLAELLEAGTVRPAIDGTYPLAEVPEAMRHLVAGKVSGKVAITVS